VISFFNKIKEKIKGIGKSEANVKPEDKSWDERRAELLEKARNKGNKKTSQVKKKKPQPSKAVNNKTEQKKVIDKNKTERKPKEIPKQKTKPAPAAKSIPKAKPVTKKLNETWSVAQFQVPVAEDKTRFHDLGLPDELMHAVAELGYQYCTPIQEKILPETLAGKDATGQAQTGTGKTAAFLITILNKFLRDNKEKKNDVGVPRALILAPTRELVIQIAKEADNLSKYCRFNIVSIFGGMSYKKQISILRNKPVDIMVATPGRLLDFLSKHLINLRSTEILVLDEADRMLDMGFMPDVKKIVRNTPKKEDRQTLLFSATLSDDIKRIAYGMTKDAANIEVDPDNIAVDSVQQIFYLTSVDDKLKIIYNMLKKKGLEKVIIFANRKDETKMLEEFFSKIDISCKALSGDVDQKQRLKTLESFKDGNVRVLIATDVAARGLHIEGVSHVINYTLPEDPEDYVHRIGRTGRAGAKGISISFADEDGAFQVPKLGKYLGHKLNCIVPEEELLT
jgi:ATP-dependent RNA helicase RhlB